MIHVGLQIVERGLIAGKAAQRQEHAAVHTWQEGPSLSGRDTNAHYSEIPVHI